MAWERFHSGMAHRQIHARMRHATARGLRSPWTVQRHHCHCRMNLLTRPILKTTSPTRTNRTLTLQISDAVCRKCYVLQRCWANQPQEIHPSTIPAMVVVPAMLPAPLKATVRPQPLLLRHRHRQHRQWSWSGPVGDQPSCQHEKGAEILSPVCTRQRRLGTFE